MLLGVSMAVENSKVGPIEEMAQSWQDEIEGRVKGLQTGSYARILKTVSYTHLTLPTR